ncbi:hypothetical protein MNBD_GAMMA26-2236 [hydrothermal vent metagenome]|uniref:SpoVT-AbrB domain-containing protein n=1 Tax=hydrothermal vent metagenome TaxID=652676 RepID=A0A3B1BAI9_9ZZZZ
MLATITAKGQVTIPKKVRDILRLHSGDKVDFIVRDDGSTLLQPVTKKAADVFGKLQKPGRKPVSISEMNETVRQRHRMLVDESP